VVVQQAYNLGLMHAKFLDRTLISKKKIRVGEILQIPSKRFCTNRHTQCSSCGRQMSLERKQKQIIKNKRKRKQMVKNKRKG
jgi:hypothetical protein